MSVRKVPRKPKSDVVKPHGIRPTEPPLPAIRTLEGTVSMPDFLARIDASAREGKAGPTAEELRQRLLDALIGGTVKAWRLSGNREELEEIDAEGWRDQSFTYRAFLNAPYFGTDACIALMNNDADQAVFFAKRIDFDFPMSPYLRLMLKWAKEHPEFDRRAEKIDTVKDWFKKHTVVELTRNQINNMASLVRGPISGDGGLFPNSQIKRSKRQ